VIARLVGAYLTVFAVVLLAASIALFALLSSQYHSLLLPALGTPEGAGAYAALQRRLALEIGASDVPLLVLVGFASWWLARISVRPWVAAQERERAFIADAAHELRSPLATIASAAQAARGDDDPARVRDALALIAATALDASGVVGDLLTLARTPKPALLQREPVDLAAIARACASEFSTRMADGKIALDLETQSAIVDGDARRLRELTRNLLENALRHARTRVVLVTGIEEGRAVLRIRDDGSGVAPQVRDRLFERFAGAADGGSGLGLAIAHWVATAHEGTLTLDPGDGGASFAARFPVMSG
jgi:signal transduction histidine kinase